MNIYVKDIENVPRLQNITDGVKNLVAQKLSSSSKELSADEVTLRMMNTIGFGMIADIEVEIIAHALDERINKQDSICLDIRKYMLENIQVDDIRVWLLLTELGHSW